MAKSGKKSVVKPPKVGCLILSQHFEGIASAHLYGAVMPSPEGPCLMRINFDGAPMQVLLDQLRREYPDMPLIRLDLSRDPAHFQTYFQLQDNGDLAERPYAAIGVLTEIGVRIEH